MKFLQIESGSERIPRGLLRGKRANGEHYYSLWIGDFPQFTAESFNSARSKSFFDHATSYSAASGEKNALRTQTFAVAVAPLR
jgi:hypothetical protein